MRRLTFVASLAVSIGSTAYASTQPDASSEETRVKLAKYGDCIVRRYQRLASRAILENVNEVAFQRDYQRLITPECLSIPPGMTVGFRFRGDSYRYALADALVRRELVKKSVPDLSTVPYLDHREPFFPKAGAINLGTGEKLTDEQLAQAQEDYKNLRAFYLLSVYGECVVRANPTAAHALLQTRPTSEEESARFIAMNRDFAGCVPQGQTLGFDKRTLRGTIAVNYYRLAKAASGPAGAAQ